MGTTRAFRGRRWAGLGTAAVVSGLLLATIGCSDGGSRLYDNDRARRLIALAGEEAGQIKSPRERLTRQLNIADDQINNGRAADARATLAGAAQTLLAAQRDSSRPTTAPAAAAADLLDDHTRLAGWVSISELSRQSNDKSAADAACGQALAALRQVEPTTDRVKYVHGIAQELRELRGKAAAATLLTDAGQWAGDIDNIARRRASLTAIASDLFASDAYEAGRDVLRRDPDAAWRADTLGDLARRAAWAAQAEPVAGAFGLAMKTRAAPPGEATATLDDRAASDSPATSPAALREVALPDSVDLSYKSNFARSRSIGSR